MSKKQIESIGENVIDNIAQDVREMIETQAREAIDDARETDEELSEKNREAIVDYVTDYMLGLNHRR